MIISGYVKYTMSFKHQLWKQKGEEYRIHGRWGWLWIRTPRNFKHVNSNELGLNGGPTKIMAQVQDDDGKKILALEPTMYTFLLDNTKKDAENKLVEIPDVLKNLEIVPTIQEFEEIDVTKALTSPGRLLYPKIAKKSKLDDLLARRVQLKVIEERRIAQKTDERKDDDETVDVEEEDLVNDGIDKQLRNMLTGKITVQNNTTPTTQTTQNVTNKELINNIAKRIQTLRTTYTNVSRLGKDFHCYCRGCNSVASTSIESTCYSPMCLQRIRVRRELLSQLRKANAAANSSNTKLANTPQKRTSILEQTLKSPQTVQQQQQAKVEKLTDENICKSLVDMLNAAPKINDDLKGIYIPKKIDETNKIKEEVKAEVKPDVEMKEEVKEEKEQ